MPEIIGDSKQTYTVIYSQVVTLPLVIVPLVLTGTIICLLTPEGNLTLFPLLQISVAWFRNTNTGWHSKSLN